MPACPPYLRPLLALFASRGERAYPVGGCVRDSLMGIPPHDWDVAVTTLPETTVALCESAGYRTIPTGIKHGTITVLVPHSGDPADREGSYELIECTTCRTEGSYTDGRHPDAVSFTGRIADDLSRRDFTVNAMAFDVDPAAEGNDLAVLDLFGGQNDLRDGVIRAVGDPDTRFTEDALRLMRAVRFAVKLGFSIEENTRSAIVRCADGLARISRERISEEFQRILVSSHPEAGVKMLDELGLLPYVLLDGISPCGMGRLSALPADFALRMACLQWGVEEEALRRNLQGLRLSNAVRKDVLALAESHSLSGEPTPQNARRWRHELGEVALRGVLLRLARGEDGEGFRGLADLIRASEEKREPVCLADLAIGGNDLLDLGFKPGKELRKALEGLLALVLEHPEKNISAELIARAKMWQE